jgi:hypothetical protein
MPSGTAQRPGDVVKSYSGQTIEVINTDAEGRLVLADVLWYCQQKYDPRFMIDLATLTGAIIVALGHEYAGFFANDDTLAQQLHAAGETTGEKVWRMPLADAYDKQIKSDIADMKNVGGRPGGAITAAQFIQRFVNGKPWVHMDVAGTVWSGKDSPTVPKGATAFGVRLLDRMVADRLLAAEARRVGLDRDAVVVAAVERALVSRLRATVLNPRAGGTEVVTDEDVRRWYDAHPDRFHIPERRRARAIFLTDRAEATRVLRLALLRRGRRYLNDFRRLAGEHNAAPDLRATRGELHEVTRAPWPYAVPLDPAASDAVFATLREGGVPIHEPGLEPMIRRNVAAGRLAFNLSCSSFGTSFSGTARVSWSTRSHATTAHESRADNACPYPGIFSFLLPSTYPLRTT